MTHSGIRRAWACWQSICEYGADKGVRDYRHPGGLRKRWYPGFLGISIVSVSCPRWHSFMRNQDRTRLCPSLRFLFSLAACGVSDRAVSLLCLVTVSGLVVCSALPITGWSYCALGNNAHSSSQAFAQFQDATKQFFPMASGKVSSCKHICIVFIILAARRMRESGS